ncbi:amino acid adenylation domain-containing protein [Streptomyces sp. NPDC007100]|uniref:amino acid adenylation domain-containing protein n=1 Tax=Streptomyces sp. NPDC007100 TaxID=3155602 RepID=UPI0033FF54A6
MPTNASASDIPLDELFAAQVRRTPDSPSLVQGARSLTYRELHARAAALARTLTAFGVREETLVALAFERSADAVVAMLGTVLAGAAYVPVSPSYPRERIEQILGDSRAPLVLCGDGLVPLLTDTAPDGTRVCELGTLMPDEAELPIEDSPLSAPETRQRAATAGSRLAYVMYTSGSTGRPKGVMVEHAGVARLVRDADYLSLSSADRILQTGALEFDAATFEIWGALLNGATLHIVEQETLLTPALLKQALHSADITVLWLTSPLFNQLADEDVSLFSGLRTLLIGGDVLSCRHVNLVRAACPGLSVLNGYGPTENTTFTTTFRIERPYETSIPIGRPIRGTTVAVLDAHGAPVPVGEIGELYTAGAGLARGYLNNPELTAEKFVPVDGVRHYRTGDLVSSDPDGVLSFHGRTDNQVKIRGHRIELGDVDNALLEIDGLTDSHTHVARRDTGGGQLVSHVVLNAGHSAQDILALLRKRLPSYMCPTHLIPVERLPLNSNGKVDRAQLPPPPVRRGTGAPPEAPWERLLARQWADVLGLDADAIGLDDDFFELGGTSLTTGVLIGRLARETGAELSFSDLFAARTLGAMARAASRAATTRLLPVPKATGSGVLHPQQPALYAVWQSDPKSLAYNIPVTVEASGPLDPDRLRTALARLIDRHDALRTHFTATHDGIRRQVEASAPVDLTVVNGTATDWIRPFDLAEPPLIRAVLERHPTGADVLNLDVHHIVFDGVSLRILIDELFDLYAGFEPDPPAVDYAAAAEWADARRSGPESARAERYWLAQFAEPVPTLNLPTDRPRPALRSARGDVLARELGPQETGDVRAVAARESLTPFTVLLTAWTAALARLSGQRDIAVGSPMGGRPHPDLEAVVGMFVNTVVLRARFPEEACLGDLLRHLGQEHSAALDHQEYPFIQLVERLGLPRDPSRNALFDTFFALQNVELHSFRKHGRHATLAMRHPGTCRFDLNLQVWQKPDRFTLELEYSTALFEPSSAAFLLDRVAEILRELALDPGSPILPKPVERSGAPRQAAEFTF